jgi:hypothetical protein
LRVGNCLNLSRIERIFVRTSQNISLGASPIKKHLFLFVLRAFPSQRFAASASSNLYRTHAGMGSGLPYAFRDGRRKANSSPCRKGFGTGP